MSREALVSAARRAFEVGERLAWKSHDPFDLLLSPYARRLPAISRFTARVFVQIGKRSGSGVRRMLRVPEHEEPKALAEFLRAAVMLAQSGEEWASDYVVDLSARLRGLAVMTPHGRGWGIGFPHVSRFGLMPPNVPNIYVTTVACQALLDEHEGTRSAAALEAAREGCRYIVEGLGSFEHGGQQWLPYVRGSSSRVVNVQASAGSLLARVGGMLRDERLLQMADRAARVVIVSQRPDGSWPYSDDGRAPFVDGFHTGFTLQGLMEYASFREQVPSSEIRAAVELGYAFFKKHLLTEDSLPRGFADGAVSLDGQNLGQCIQTLVVCGTEADARTALGLWQVGLGADLSDEGLPRGGKFPALRWTLGPGVLATAQLLRRFPLAIVSPG